MSRRPAFYTPLLLSLALLAGCQQANTRPQMTETTQPTPAPRYTPTALDQFFDRARPGDSTELNDTRLGSGRLVAGERYLSASGRNCMRAVLQSPAPAPVVACRQPEGRWTLRHAFTPAAR